jgi:hypothetical protein
MNRPRTCDCELRDIHGGRFNRCRKGATRQIRVVDTRTLGDVKAGRLTPEPGQWFYYCTHCADEILRRQGATVEEGGML